MGKITIIANNFFENASGSIRDDGAQISNQSTKKVVQNSKKEISYDKNKDRKPPTDIRITKVEGPFDGNGKLVDKIVLGASYIFKATTTRKPTVPELKLLKWAVKLDDTEKQIILGAANYNKLEGDKIILPLKLNHTFENAKVYAFYQKADDAVCLDIKNKDVFHPYIIAQSRHRKGMNEEGTATHHDMMSKDMTDAEIITLNPDTKKWIDIVNKEGFQGIKKLADEMEDLLTDFSQGELEDINLKMYKKFVGNKEGDFSDEILTKAAKEHDSTKLFLKRLKENMKLQLQQNPNFVFEKQLLVNNDKNLYIPGTKIQRKDIPSPTYSDKYGGLGIAINDTWGYNVIITNFVKDEKKRTFAATFDIDFFDHYGLNSEDIDPKIKGGFFEPASFEGFLCWFILQHKCGYKPFCTVIKIKNKTVNETY
ncbi:DUF3289 family protein [Flavobacterium sp. 5]|uniref:DUF3289 family protein n=1 Tax=Flavobacterium sp. 5 TaxID=2035199 RepID=UPI000C2C12A6|nr:DUF3289 family protein [Flavobacterium sp. 5]PKB18716.1 uncharacterized protein DUF3289 [Flavobacterium sp. 5]